MKTIDFFLKIRIKKVQKYLQELDLSALLVTSPVHLFYLTDYSNRDGVVLITKNKIFYLIDSRSVLEASQKIKTMEVLLLDETRLQDLLKHLKITTLGFEANFVTVSLLDSLKKKLKPIKLKKTKDVIENLRHIKDELEISRIKKACDISKEVYQLIEKNFHSFKTEHEIAYFYEQEVKKRGAEKIAFKMIVANAKGSGIPHYTTSDKKMNFNKSTLLDFGCEYLGYCSDTSRTILPKKVSKKISDIYNLVYKAKKIAVSKIKAEINASDLDKSVKDFFKKNGVYKYFTHSLGHSVGLKVHDGLVVHEKKDLILKEGMVITIEPGLYLENDFGVRLEDTYLVRKTGFEKLT